MDWRSTVHPQHLENVKTAYQRMLGEARAELECLGVRKDGSVFWKQIVMVKAHDQHGQWTGHHCFMKDINERKRAEEHLRDLAARLQVLSRRLVEVQEAERHHLARELHDEIGQVLSAIGLNLHIVKSVCDAAAFPRIEDSIRIVDQATAQVRALSLDLRPAMLDDLGLTATLRWLVDREAQRAGLVAHINVRSSGAPLPPDVAVAAFRMVQESLTNVVRHARARNVWVELRQRDDELDLAIRDDGVGFDPDSACNRATRGESFGLLGIQERAALLGGRADIRSRPGHGTKIRVWLPIESPPSAEVSSDGSLR
jgi:signal transduction histidine kinase